MIAASSATASQGWREGDRVTFDSTVSCGDCWFCRRGQINLCDNRRVLGVSCDEYRRNGAFADYVAVPQRILYRLPDELTFARAAMVEPVSVAVHAVGRLAVRLNDTAVVVGAGMIGLLLIQALRAAGCGRIIAVDLEPRRLELARRLGADRSDCAPRATIRCRALLALTGGRGADVAFDVVGLASTVRTGRGRVSAKGGQVALVGNLAPQVELPLAGGGGPGVDAVRLVRSSGEYPACLDLIAAGHDRRRSLDQHRCTVGRKGRHGSDGSTIASRD